MLTANWNSVRQCYDLKISTKYGNGDFDRYVACIKIIPTLNRSFDPVKKEWSIEENFWSVLETLLKGAKLPYTFNPKPTAPPPFLQGPYLSEQDKHILTFFKSLSYEVASKAFKLGMAENHPDLNPNDTQASDKCATLSEAWQYIKKNFYQK